MGGRPKPRASRSGAGQISEFDLLLLHEVLLQLSLVVLGVVLILGIHLATELFNLSVLLLKILHHKLHMLSLEFAAFRQDEAKPADLERRLIFALGRELEAKIDQDHHHVQLHVGLVLNRLFDIRVSLPHSLLGRLLASLLPVLRDEPIVVLIQILTLLRLFKLGEVHIILDNKLAHNIA